MKQTLSPLFTWRSAVASPYGPDSSTRRHVLMTLSLHMNEKGRSCYPSQARLSKETGLDRRTVERHISGAADDGWLDIERRSGQSNRYTPSIPTEFWDRLDEGLDAGERLAEELVQSVPERFTRPAKEEVITQDTPGTMPGGRDSDDGGPPAENRGGQSDTPGREPGDPRHSVGEPPGTVPGKDDIKDVTEDDHHHPSAQARTGGGAGGGGGGCKENNSDEGSVSQELVAALTAEGVSEKNAEQLVAEHEWSAIYLQLLHYRHRMERGGQYAPESAGWIVDAVREGYALPDAVRRSASLQPDGTSTNGQPPTSLRSGGEEEEGGRPDDSSSEEEPPADPPDLDFEEICGVSTGTAPVPRDYRNHVSQDDQDE